MSSSPSNSHHSKNKKLFLVPALAVVIILLIAVFVAIQISPWPKVLIIRYVFAQASLKVSQALEKHLPNNVLAQFNLQYSSASKDTYLDVFYPATAENDKILLPAIVWVHGGGWIAGSKEETTNYAKIIASKGYSVIVIDYSLAPAATYPTPVRQLNDALSYLEKNAHNLHIDPSAFFLAGDSAGAHIVAQMANIITSPSYAQKLDIRPSLNRSQLAGAILYCGPYNLEQPLDGSFGNFTHTVLWAYSGSKNAINDPKFSTASIIKYVSPTFPPTFISAGNADPLEPQSHAFAKALIDQGVQVDSLFFKSNFLPSLPHEYQFNIDTQAGQEALTRSVAFISSHTKHTARS